ncbi:MAG: hypothetical protein A3F72_18405 [Bacteroidetes bacterium RIFCSPLOWO2_12_FULL_35_15]|nr:MAG: hypothetical protein A3F72_18405 [Bacteroidetes bacterium RIFCSPLOWO2_12_FULL_35_15]
MSCPAFRSKLRKSGGFPLQSGLICKVCIPYFAEEVSSSGILTAQERGLAGVNKLLSIDNIYNFFTTINLKNNLPQFYNLK